MLYIFDWDGTISNSADKIVACMQVAAEASGLEVLADDDIKNIIGLGLPEAIERLYPGIQSEKVQELTQHYSQNFLQRDQTPSPFFPGVMETLETLRGRGHSLAVATGKSRRGLNRVLGKLKLDDFFHASRCADETASKPHPLMLNELLEECSVDVGRAVMIGDTEYDMEMAQGINMPRIAVSYGVHAIERLKKFEPDLCVDRFSDILNW